MADEAGITVSLGSQDVRITGPVRADLSSTALRTTPLGYVRRRAAAPVVLRRRGLAD